ncbi:hypothetical protein GA0115234_100425 [Streptomyces sp. DvalAA-43]|jgi:hypothetical protein|nr:hypothetical protein GA0115234_100425 [Streptomyces sp. DvalAA-43]
MFLTDRDGGLPVMTIKVYEVDRYGLARIIRPRAEVDPLKDPPESSKYPPCQCGRCEVGQR